MNNSIKLITLGDEAVGKTSIISSFLGKPFVRGHYQTNGVAEETTEVIVEGKPWDLHLIDTLGHKKNRT